MQFKSHWSDFIGLKCDLHVKMELFDSNLTASRYGLHRAARAGAVLFSQELVLKFLS